MTPAARKRSSYARRLVLMVKEPGVGRVKRRLAREIGAVRAAAFYRHTTAAVLGRVGGGAGWVTILAVTPDTGIGSSAWPSRFSRVAQGGNDLGARMQRVMDRLPPGPVLIIGSDIPGIRAAHIRTGFAALGAHDAVLGPSPDGGYWLVGLKRSPRVPRAFVGVRWSTGEALADTVRNLAGSKIARIATLADVDRSADLPPFAGAHGRRILPSPL